MNFGQVSELEQAAWPVFRVDKSRRICGVNKAAYERFGERLETLQLSGIWTGANSDAHWNSLWQSGAGPQKLTLTDKTQKEFEATVLISRVQSKEHEQLLFQVVGNVPAAPVEASPSQGVEVNLA